MGGKEGKGMVIDGEPWPRRGGGRGRRGPCRPP